MAKTYAERTMDDLSAFGEGALRLGGGAVGVGATVLDTPGSVGRGVVGGLIEDYEDKGQVKRLKKALGYGDDEPAVFETLFSDYIKGQDERTQSLYDNSTSKQLEKEYDEAWEIANQYKRDYPDRVDQYNELKANIPAPAEFDKILSYHKKKEYEDFFLRAAQSDNIFDGHFDQPSFRKKYGPFIGTIADIATDPFTYTGGLGLAASAYNRISGPLKVPVSKMKNKIAGVLRKSDAKLNASLIRQDYNKQQELINKQLRNTTDPEVLRKLNIKKEGLEQQKLKEINEAFEHGQLSGEDLTNLKSITKYDPKYGNLPEDFKPLADVEALQLTGRSGDRASYFNRIKDDDAKQELINQKRSWNIVNKNKISSTYKKYNLDELEPPQVGVNASNHIDSVGEQIDAYAKTGAGTPAMTPGEFHQTINDAISTIKNRQNVPKGSRFLDDIESIKLSPDDDTPSEIRQIFGNLMDKDTNLSFKDYDQARNGIEKYIKMLGPEDGTKKQIALTIKRNLDDRIWENYKYSSNELFSNKPNMDLLQNYTRLKSEQGNLIQIAEYSNALASGNKDVLQKFLGDAVAGSVSEPARLRFAAHVLNTAINPTTSSLTKGSKAGRWIHRQKEKVVGPPRNLVKTIGLRRGAIAARGGAGVLDALSPAEAEAQAIEASTFNPYQIPTPYDINTLTPEEIEQIQVEELQRAANPYTDPSRIKFSTVR